MTGDGKTDLVVGTGSVGRSAVRILRAPDRREVETFLFTADDRAAGAYVG